MKGHRGVLFAADYTSRDACLERLPTVIPYVDAIKVGHPLLLSAGLGIIEDIRKMTGMPLVADLKVMDICDVARKTVDLVASFGYDGVTICGHCGTPTIRECIRRASPMGVFVFTQLTTQDGLTDPDTADQIAEIARDEGALGVQAPATMPWRVARVREIVGPELVLIACGVGAQGPAAGSAVKAGADYEIIGRAIYANSDPSLAARRAATSIRAAIRDCVGDARTLPEEVGLRCAR